MKHIKAALKQKRYINKLVLYFFVVLLIAAFLTNAVSLIGFIQGKIILNDFISISGVLFILVFSFLAGLSITMHVYRKDVAKNSKSDKIGMLGGAVGLLTSACTVCYPLIFTLIGIPTAFAILPLGGLEIQILSILLLLLSLFLTNRSIENCEKCKIV